MPRSFVVRSFEKDGTPITKTVRNGITLNVISSHARVTFKYQN